VTPLCCVYTNSCVHPTKDCCFYRLKINHRITVNVYAIITRVFRLGCRLPASIDLSWHTLLVSFLSFFLYITSIQLFNLVYILLQYPFIFPGVHNQHPSINLGLHYQHPFVYLCVHFKYPIHQPSSLSILINLNTLYTWRCMLCSANSSGFH
jgi:hypothetical protein